MEMFLVGGAVRDELLGVQSKDIDYTVTISDEEYIFATLADVTPFEFMVAELKQRGFKIFLETPEFLTVRAQFPEVTLPSRPGIIAGTTDLVKRTRKGLTADFVLARKESDYTDGRRPDRVEPGTLADDLSRRDFTMNAIAKDQNGNLIDPFNGAADINARIIRAVGNPNKRFTEDALRIVRALRFSVTKGFDIDPRTEDAMWRLRHTVAGVSAERVREELTKMFNADPMATIQILREMDMLPIIFGMGINFQPTLKERIR